MPEPMLVPVPLARGRRGAVVAPHHLATAAGLEVLAAGGTAVDAAIATNAALAVVAPNMCGIGGDAFWLIWDEASGRQHGLNGSGRSAAATDAPAMARVGLATIPRRGPLSVTVPGAVRSWQDAHERFGRLDPGRILAPAVDLAQSGFPAWDEFIEATEGMAEVADRAFLQMYRPASRRWRAAEIVRLPALARTLERLAGEGFGAFYTGDLAESQVRALGAAGSPLDLADFEDHRSTWTEPIETTYRGVRVTSHRPNSSGVVALEILNVLEQFEPPGPGSLADDRWIHLGIEASKLAMADRDRHLADEDVAPVPIDRLLDKGYAADLAGRIDARRAAPAPAASLPRAGGTAYMAVVDGAGNAVSLIQSNYMGFGSGVADAATGIHYQNRGSFFTLEPGHPNVLAPRKRPLHTLLPGMLFRAGARRPWVVVGSRGGDAQPQIHAQVVSSLVDGDADVQAAVSLPRWFVEPAEHFAPPVDVRIESRFAPEVLDSLRDLGHPVTELGAFDRGLGPCHAIELVDGGPAEDGGSLAAATDPRSQGLPAVR